MDRRIRLAHPRVLGSWSVPTFFVLYQTIASRRERVSRPRRPRSTTPTASTNRLVRDAGPREHPDRRSAGLDAGSRIAAEDRSFYTNRGIDFKGIIRAARNNATSGEIQGGGSTITQQYVKIHYLTAGALLHRKVKEAILSIKIHKQLTKKEILEGYLNTIYFGNGAYGVEVASQTYFNKPAKELDFEESALLRDDHQQPVVLDPYARAPRRLTPRFDYVLDGMLKSAP